MADKKRKTNHARLVVPGSSTSGKKQGKKKATPQKPLRSQPQQELPAPEPPLPENAIMMPTDGKAFRKKLRRKKRRKHSLQFLVLAAVFVLVLFVYLSGLYRTAVLKGAEMVEGIRVSLAGGSGFPLSFSMRGYAEGESVGKNAAALLGEKDLVIISAKGRELYRVQHGFGNPHITTGNTRVCVYNRGGTEYYIEGRDRRIIARTADREILFAEMSDSGGLALITASRFRSFVEVYSDATDEEWQWSWDITDEQRPYAAAFHSDNKHLALACISTRDGSVYTRIHLWQTNRDDVQAVIESGGMTVLEMQYLSSGKLLVLYDKAAIVYDAKGNETARYNYGGDIASLHSEGGITALAFSSISMDKATVVVLDAGLNTLGSFVVEGTAAPKLLVAGKNVFALADYDVAAYTADGTLLNTYTTTERGYGLLYAGAPLMVGSASIQSLEWMLDAEATGPGEDSSLAGEEGTDPLTPPQDGETVEILNPEPVSSAPAGEQTPAGGETPASEKPVSETPQSEPESGPQGQEPEEPND